MSFGRWNYMTGLFWVDVLADGHYFMFSMFSDIIIMLDNWLMVDVIICNYIVIPKCIENPKRHLFFFILCIVVPFLGFHTQFHICSWG